MNHVKVFLLALLAASCVFADGGVSTIRTIGKGDSSEDAVADALEKALLSQCGMTVSITRRTQAEASTANGDSNVSDQLKHNCQTVAQGRIAGFDVESVEQDSDSGKWIANVTVKIYSRYIVGTDPAKRRRMALAPLICKQKAVSLCCKEWQIASILSALEDKLAEGFTQTRKFTMLDRKYDEEVDAELARLTRANASAADFARMNQRLVTDYLFCGEVTFFDPPAVSVNPHASDTNQTATPVMQIAYRVLLAPTGQLKWAKTISVYQDFAIGAPPDQTFMNLLTVAAADTCDSVMENIIPMRVAKIGLDDRVILNQGGDTVNVGETLDVFLLGEDVIDPVTGESLGREELEVAKIQVEKVEPKKSYARIVSGDAAKVGVGDCVVRRPAPLNLGAGHGAVSEKDSELKKQILELCRQPLDSSPAGKWFLLIKEIASDELRQIILKATGSALIYAGRSNVYNVRVKPLIKDASLFEKPFYVKCSSCDGRKIIEKRCGACTGSGICKFSNCRNGRHLIHRFEGCFYETCKDCRGTGRCQKCGATGRIRSKCLHCDGKGIVISRNAAAETYHTCVEVISRSCAGLTVVE